MPAFWSLAHVWTTCAVRAIEPSVFAGESVFDWLTPAKMGSHQLLFTPAIIFIMFAVFFFTTGEYQFYAAQTYGSLDPAVQNCLATSNAGRTAYGVRQMLSWMWRNVRPQHWGAVCRMCGGSCADATCACCSQSGVGMHASALASGPASQSSFTCASPGQPAGPKALSAKSHRCMLLVISQRAACRLGP